MGQVLALEQHTDAEALGQPATFGDGGRTPAVVTQQALVLGVERTIGPCGVEGSLELLAGRYQRLGKEPAPELAEPAVGARLCERRH